MESNTNGFQSYKSSSFNAFQNTHLFSGLRMKKIFLLLLIIYYASYNFFLTSMLLPLCFFFFNSPALGDVFQCSNITRHFSFPMHGYLTHLDSYLFIVVTSSVFTETTSNLRVNKIRFYLCDFCIFFDPWFSALLGLILTFNYVFLLHQLWENNLFRYSLTE